MDIPFLPNKMGYRQALILQDKHSKETQSAENFRQLALSCFPNADQVALVLLDVIYDNPGQVSGNAEIWLGKTFVLHREHHAEEKSTLKSLEKKLKNIASLDQHFYHADKHALAILAALDNNISYYSARKQLDHFYSERLKRTWKKYIRSSVNAGLSSYKNLPVYPIQPIKPECAGLALMSIFVITGILINAFPLFIGWLAGLLKKKDSSDTRFLWQITATITSGGVWISVGASIALLANCAHLILFYTALTFILPKFYNPFIRSLKASYNALIFPALRKRFLEIRKALLHSL